MATPPPAPAPPSPDAEAEEARELLYEAYNELQALAAPAPAVVVVGHQTDGKSALVEALMGFQFNYVGGGTKTSRPVALHLRFNPRCDEPQCRLLTGPVDVRRRRPRPPAPEAFKGRAAMGKQQEGKQLEKEVK